MTRARTLQAGVVGVGNMGANHARLLRELPGVDLVGVADTHLDRANEVARAYDTRTVETEELLDRADAVVVAVPTRDHFAIASMALDAGTHLLVEKPFVADRTEGLELDRRAREQDLILQVGHVERFNPAVEALLDLVDREEIVAIRADRLGPPVNRDVERDVVPDLMIHDIDIVLALMGRQPDSVTSRSCRSGRYASMLCEFDDSTVATLTASRLTQRKVRRLHVTTPDRLLVVDYLDQSVQIHRRSRPEYFRTDEDIRYRHESVIERPLIESAEPLKRELQSFLSAVRTGDSPVITAADALDAMDLVWTIQRQIGKPSLEVSRS